MTLEEAGLARQALLAAAGCARRLRRSQKKLAQRFPLNAAAVADLAPEAEDDLDAFLKRFEPFRTLTAIRNRIAHVYPDDPERQAANLNEADAAVDDLLAAHEAGARYLERRL